MKFLCRNLLLFCMVFLSISLFANTQNAKPDEDSLEGAIQDRVQLFEKICKKLESMIESQDERLLSITSSSKMADRRANLLVIILHFLVAQHIGLNFTQSIVSLPVSFILGSCAIGLLDLYLRFLNLSSELEIERLLKKAASLEANIKISEHYKFSLDAIHSKEKELITDYCCSVYRVSRQGLAKSYANENFLCQLCLE